MGLIDWLIENHDLAAVAFDQEGDEVEAEAGESVTMGNHNPELIAAQESFQ
ncbi:hypothetical protein EDC35_102330 [Thiobaca trueperi]|uniref:Uncharacterized protein n=1 Tax=Thiobaca trueperi TaxID=127458 RepID=A0A4R3N288_9GAMM|nr:hypothetical protein EDC35_102330 [Thiobaca trueperi]